MFVTVCCCMSTRCVLSGDRQELAAVLRYHLGEGMLVSGGVASHTRLTPLQGEKLELGVVSPPSSSSLTSFLSKISTVDVFFLPAKLHRVREQDPGGVRGHDGY